MRSEGLRNVLKQELRLVAVLALSALLALQWFFFSPGQVSSGEKAVVLEELAKSFDFVQSRATVSYKARPGDFITSIAMRYNMKEPDVLKMNPAMADKKDDLEINQVIYLRVNTEATK